MFKGLFRFAWFVLLAALLQGQVDTGVLSGRVFDNTGAAVPGAKIHLVNTGTNYTLDLTTSADGLYVSPPLPPGNYRLEASHTGFQTEAKQLSLHLSERLAVDFNMKLGSMTESVTVQELAPVLQTENSTLSVLRSDQEVKDLPNNGRLFSEIIRYSPGTVPFQAQRTGSLAISQVRGNTSNAVNGADFQDNNFLVDGIQNNEGHQGYGVLIFPELEAIENYRVETSVPDARFGRTGGTVNVSYKSGTNQFHGEAFEFLRNDKLDARNFFNSGAKPAFRKNDFGGVFGGPVGGKDSHTFFFLSYEGQQLSQGKTSVTNVPLLPMRNGDFSQLLTQARPITIYDPLTSQIGANGTISRQPFEGNMIPAVRFSGPGKHILDYYPAPNLPAAGNNFLLISKATAGSNQGTAKIDHDFGEGSRMFVRLTDASENFVQPQNLLGPIATPFTAIQAPSVQGVASLTTILSPHHVNQVRVGATRENLRTVSLNGGQNVAQQFGIPNVNVDNFTTGLSYITVSGFPVMGDQSSNPAVIAMNHYQVSDNIGMVLGDHNVTVGFDVVRRQTNIFQAGVPRGEFDFSTIYTNNPASPANTGYGPADLLLGKPQTVLLTYIQGTRGLRRTDWDGYVQDDWKLGRRLTLNFGLRYDLLNGYPYNEVAGRQLQFDVVTGKPVPVGGSIPGAGVASDKKDFAPRLGLSWKVRETTVLRLAWGIFYFEKPFALDRGLATNPPNFLNTTVANDQTNFSGARGLSDGPLRVLSPDAPGQNYTGIATSYRLPSMQQWNVSLQQQLPGQQQLTVAYVGTKGTHLLESIQLNQAVPGDGPVNARRRWPQYGNVRMQTFRGGSTYESLQALVSKRLSSGLNYQASYTWSHALDEANPDGNTLPGIPQYSLYLNRGNGDADIRHQFRGTFGYELPFGRGRYFGRAMNRVADQVAGGWQLAGGVTFYSGFPFDVAASSNTLNIGEGSRANRLSNGNLPSDQRTLTQWFNTAAFADPGFRVWGNEGRNVLVGPGTKQVDLSFFKTFPITESKRLQFRAELYNFTNTPQFNSPNATIGSPTFGQVTSAGSELSLQRAQRQVQVSMKFYF